MLVPAPTSWPPSRIRGEAARRGRGCRGAGLLARDSRVAICAYLSRTREMSSVHGYHRGPGIQVHTEPGTGDSGILKGRCW